MQSLRERDGTPLHRRVIRFHSATCRGGGAPLHKDLRAEATAVYNDLKAKERAHEDAEDDLVDATAEVDTTEIAFENAIRDLDSALERFDRDYPGKNARSAVFPEGYGAVIEPEGDKQLEVLPALHVRLDPFKNEPPLADSLAKLQAAETAFRDALTAEGAASEAVDTAFAKEIAARAAVRAQLTSAHGRLRDLYKSRPAQAERFFMKLGRKEGKGTGAGGGGAQGGGGDGAQGGGEGAPPGG
jgi:hypothetical protein